MDNKIMELFEENFGFAFRTTTYNNMIVANKSFEQFKKKNEDFVHLKKERRYLGI